LRSSRLSVPPVDDGRQGSRRIRTRRIFKLTHYPRDREFEKRLALDRLRARIVREVLVVRWRDVWFFPKDGRVHGWQGTQDIMFVGLNPSTGRFPSPADRSFYRALATCGFERAHLTDAIKERATGAALGALRDDPERMRTHRRYLRAEAKIIAPRLIVAVGQRAKRIVDEWLPGDRRVLEAVPHFAQRFASPKTRRRFTAEMKRIRLKYAALGRVQAGPRQSAPRSTPDPK
jgi:uracil-DNA glycosylase